MPLLVPPAANAEEPRVRAITGLFVYVATVTAPVLALVLARVPY
ncbi:hypothetical protein [Streptomyces sp. 3214.6]|nr:hypothetical protein [Streptomyces sp. 3214.6]SHI11806.1 hypothetical protein SAMN05444521_4119 [Streptomyces sp. 3214.6]